MPTTRNTKVVVWDEEEDRVIGYVSNSGCENPTCFGHICAGKRWHATPAGHAVTLPEYHFRELDQAIFALQGVFRP